MKNIILFFGGRSPEHDISIITAMQVKANLNPDKYNIFPVYITKENKWLLVEKLNRPQEFIDFNSNLYPEVFLRPSQNILYKEGRLKTKKVCKVDCAVIACHGDFGEDGRLQGLLDMSNVPYTSSGVKQSALCMDKVLTKEIFEVNNLPTTKYVWFKKSDYIENQQKILKDIEKEIEYPMVVKPANLGSSIGISVCKDRNSLEDAIDIAKCFDHKILVEEAVLHLREINIAVYKKNKDLVLSSISEPPTWQEFFDFDKKYLQNIKAYNHKMEKLPPYITKQIKNIALKSYKVFELKGVVRFDFLYNTDTEELFVSEINSIPGSFANFLFKNLSFENLLDNLIESAILEQKFEANISHTFESKVLSSGVVKK